MKKMARMPSLLSLFLPSFVALLLVACSSPAPATAAAAAAPPTPTSGRALVLGGNGMMGGDVVDELLVLSAPRFDTVYLCHPPNADNNQFRRLVAVVLRGSCCCCCCCCCFL